MKNIAVLIGRGGRLKAIYECATALKGKAQIKVVISHKKDSPGIDWAKSKGVEAFYFRLTDWRKKGGDREGYMQKLAAILKKEKINLIIMAGWDLIMSNRFLKEFPWQVINVHPSLCPAFPGLEAPKQALEYGAKWTGATVHFVPDEGVDSGPVIIQEPVKIEDNETLESLEAKIHLVEEKILCQAIHWLVEDKLVIRGRQVRLRV